METIIKSFVGIFFMMLIAAIGMGCVSVAVNIREADIFISDAAEKIENSNFSNSVIAACISDAAAHSPAYELSAEITAAANDKTKKYGSLYMNYSYRIPIIGITEERSIHEELR